MHMNRLIPMLPVKSIPASVAFYQKLGFSVEKRNDDWRWAMLRFDVEYHRQVRENGLTCPDLDVTFYGLTEFRLDDPDGNRLWIGQNCTSA